MSETKIFSYEPAYTLIDTEGTNPDIITNTNELY